MSLPTSDGGFNAFRHFQSGLNAGPPWDSIVTFATHRSFCGKKLYPRQLTLLKLIYLETDQMTQYDFDVIEEWRQGFKDRTAPHGVQPDVWDRVDYLKEHRYHHFPHVQFVGGRRGSKGIVGGILGAERLAHFYSLGDWQQHYGLDPGTVGEITVVATSQYQAARRLFADIRRTVENCVYLREHIVGNRYLEFSIRTPADEQRISDMKLAGVSLDREIATLYANASSATSTSIRGGSTLMAAYDEMAHLIAGTGSSKAGDEIYSALQPSLDQFGIDKMTYCDSSPYTQIGQFYELYKHGSVMLDVYNEREGRMQRQTITEKTLGTDAEEELDTLTADPEMLLIQLPSWALYADWERSRTIPLSSRTERCFPKWKRPVQWPPEGDRPENKAMARMRLRNPDKFKVERFGLFAAVMDAYLDEAKVDQMFATPTWRSPLAEQDRGKFSIVYRAHADPSRTNANFGFAIAHLEDGPCDGCGWHPSLDTPVHHRPNGFTPKHKCPNNGHIWPHVIIDKLKVWKPQDYPDHTVDYVQIGEELDSYLTRFPSIKTMTYDQYNSAGFIAAQKRKFPNIRIGEKTFTLKENQDRFEKFKSALNLGWVHTYRDAFYEDGQSLLELELKFLQEKNGKVERQEIGPVTTKDLADAVMVVTVDLLHEHLDRWYQHLNRVAVGSTAAAPLKSGREAERLVAAGVTSTASSLRGEMNRQRIDDMRRDRTRRVRDHDRSPLRTRGRSL